MVQRAANPREVDGAESQLAVLLREQRRGRELVPRPVAARIRAVRVDARAAADAARAGPEGGAAGPRAARADAEQGGVGRGVLAGFCDLDAAVSGCGCGERVGAYEC